MRRTVLWVQLVVVALVLSGCAGLPHSAEVRQRQAVGSAPPVVIEVQPDPPARGASPKSIAEGFLRAHVGRADNFGVARQYLTNVAQGKWDPAEHGIVVLRNVNFTVSTSRGASEPTLSALAVARTDKSGHLTQLPTPQTVSVTFRMAKDENGQWRITSLPDDLGLWLVQQEFETYYDELPVYYAASGGARVLVPDWRWLPSNSGPAALAEAVLDTPPAWLRPAIRPKRPADVALVGETVPVSRDNGVATVTMTDEALKMAPEDRRALWACMLVTLRAARGVQRVQLMVGDSKFTVPEVDDDPLEIDLGYQVVEQSEPNAVVRTGDQLRWVSSAGESKPGTRPRSDSAQPPFSDTLLPAVGDNWFMLAANVERAEVAAVSGDRTTLGRWRRGSLWQQPPSFGRQLTRPHYDGFGSLWVAGQALVGGDAPGPGKPKTPGPATMWVIDTNASIDVVQPQVVQAPWLAGKDVLSFAISSEGRRVALILYDRTTKSTSLVLSSVVRTGGEITALTEPVALNPAVESLVDVTWADDHSLGVIGKTRAADATEQPIEVPLNGGPAVPLGRAPGAVYVAGAGEPMNGPYVVTNQNQVLVRQGQKWRKLQDGKDVAVPVPSRGAIPTNTN